MDPTTATVPPEWDLGPLTAILFPGRTGLKARLPFQTVPGVSEMSYRCEICGKEPSFGRTVSFSHKRNNRRWLPNIQKVRVRHGSNTRRARVCTSCIRAGKIEKA